MPITLQEIDISVAANDNLGDKGRIAFDKVNDNFAVMAASLEDAERKAWVIPITTEDGVVAVADSVTFPMPYAFVLLDVRGWIETADSGGDIEIDITEDGVSVLGSGESLIIPSGSNSSVGYSPAPTISDTILADNSVVKIEVISASGVSVAANLKVTLIGYVIWTTF